ncbi:MAG: hypothetical protein LCH26_05670 [Proteobacteria bacterium]|nr:hypothetical protein [Pseudomonadota bacterium]
MTFSLLSSIMFFAFLTSAWSAPTLNPGHYILQGNHGTLSVNTDASKQMTFEIETVGANGHQCALSGTLQGTEGVTQKLEGDKEACRVSFVQTGPHRIDVKSQNDTCRGFCGMRATFDGTYQIPPKACSQASIKKRRKEFLNTYQSKDYPGAEAILTPLLEGCGDFIDWIEEDEIRNEIALTQLHQGNPQACLAALSKTMASGAAGEEELTLPPLDREAYLATAKKIWFNKRLCEKALKPASK